MGKTTNYSYPYPEYNDYATIPDHFKALAESIDADMKVAKSSIANKVDKEEGKGLSSNDYTAADKAEVAKVANKVDQVEGKGLSTNDYTDEAVAEVAKIANKVDKIDGKGLSSNDYTDNDKAEVATIANKVDKIDGKGLSTNDYTDVDKAAVDKIGDVPDGKTLQGEIDEIVSGGGSGSFEKTENKVTEITYDATDTQYPSAKAVYDQILNGALPKSIVSSIGSLIGRVDVLEDEVGDVPDDKTLQGQIDTKPTVESGTFTATYNGTSIRSAYCKTGDWCKVIIPISLSSAAFSQAVSGLPFAAGESISGVCAGEMTNISEVGVIVWQLSKNNDTFTFSCPYTPTDGKCNLVFEYPTSTTIPVKSMVWSEMTLDKNFSVKETLLSKDANGIRIQCNAAGGGRSIGTWGNDLTDVTKISFTAKTETTGAKIKVQIGSTDSPYYELSADGTEVTIVLADIGVTPTTGMDVNFYSNIGSAIISISDVMMY